MFGADVDINISRGTCPPNPHFNKTPNDRTTTTTTTTTITHTHLTFMISPNHTSLLSRNMNSCLAFSVSVPMRQAITRSNSVTQIPSVRKRPPLTHRARIFATSSTPPATATEPTATTPTTKSPPESLNPLFQCPVCQTPLPAVPELKLDTLPAKCATCTNPFQQRPGYVDLTATRTTPTTPDDPPLPLKVLSNLITQTPGQSIFQLPFVSYAYERGWRAGFARAGFPGIEKELDILLDHVLPADTVLDMSCGSGLMARRLATCGSFRRVVAADYSDTMLRETVAQASADVMVPEFDVVRADVARLPFVSAAFDAVHSGAALHCWPNVQDGLREICRVLKPGKGFVATTFLKGAYLSDSDAIMRNPGLKRLIIRAVESLPTSSAYRFFEEDELRYLFRAAGFVDVELVVIRGFVAIKCRKPEKV